MPRQHGHNPIGESLPHPGGQYDQSSLSKRRLSESIYTWSRGVLAVAATGLALGGLAQFVANSHADRITNTELALNADQRLSSRQQGELAVWREVGDDATDVTRLAAFAALPSALIFTFGELARRDIQLLPPLPDNTPPAGSPPPPVRH